MSQEERLAAQARLYVITRALLPGLPRGLGPCIERLTPTGGAPLVPVACLPLLCLMGDLLVRLPNATYLSLAVHALVTCALGGTPHAAPKLLEETLSALMERVTEHARRTSAQRPARLVAGLLACFHRHQTMNKTLRWGVQQYLQADLPGWQLLDTRIRSARSIETREPWQGPELYDHMCMQYAPPRAVTICRMTDTDVLVTETTCPRGFEDFVCLLFYRLRLGGMLARRGGALAADPPGALRLLLHTIASFDLIDLERQRRFLRTPCAQNGGKKHVARGTTVQVTATVPEQAPLDEDLQKAIDYIPRMRELTDVIERAKNMHKQRPRVKKRVVRRRPVGSPVDDG